MPWCKLSRRRLTCAAAVTNVNRAQSRLDAVNHEPVEPTFRRLARPVGALLRRVTRPDWDEHTHLPATGPVIVVVNHLSDADPLLLAHYVVWSGRWPRFLAKHSLWDVPVLGRILQSLGQIPVHRGTAAASGALDAAKEALNQHKCVVIYPEGTLTFDPEYWPMAGRTGAARLAQETGAPVIPIAQWGAHRIMPNRKVTWPRLIPRPVITMRSGPPVNLTGLGAVDATEAIMDALTALLARIRDEEPPSRWDPRKGGR